jgi:hypothetical protein
MSAAKVTPWFDGRVKPVREGVYQRDYNQHGNRANLQYCYWNGRHFSRANGTVDSADTCEFRSDAQHLPWRGLASDPEASK